MVDASSSALQSLSTLRAMREQETKYTPSSSSPPPCPSSSSSSSAASAAAAALPLHVAVRSDDEDDGDRSPGRPLAEAHARYRCRMVSWCYQIVDYCKLRRETVEIAMNYVDRYVVAAAADNRTPSPCSVERRHRGLKLYQLVVMTCLYVAVKVHEPTAMDLNLVSELSRRVYAPQEIEVMEFRILSTLQWRVNPPTALSFVRNLVELIPEDDFREMIMMDEDDDEDQDEDSEEDLEEEEDVTVTDPTTIKASSTSTASTAARHAVLELAKYQTELAVHSRPLIDVRASTIAVAALLNALVAVAVDHCGGDRDAAAVSIEQYEYDVITSVFSGSSAAEGTDGDEDEDIVCDIDFMDEAMDMIDVVREHLQHTVLQQPTTDMKSALLRSCSSSFNKNAAMVSQPAAKKLCTGRPASTTTSASSSSPTTTTTTTTAAGTDTLSTSITTSTTKQKSNVVYQVSPRSVC